MCVCVRVRVRVRVRVCTRKSKGFYAELLYPCNVYVTLGSCSEYQHQTASSGG